MLAKELERLADLGARDLQVPPGVGVQGLAPGAEQVEKPQPVIPGKQFVVPLQEEQDGDGDRLAARAKAVSPSPARWPNNPKSAAVLLGSAAASGMPNLVPIETPK